jgi:hypothetical protein
VPLTFNFEQSADNADQGTGTRSVSDDFSAGGTFLTFTLSSADSDNKSVQMGAENSLFGIGFDDGGSNDVFTLRFVTTSLGVSDGFSGPIVIQGGFVQGTIDVTFLTAGGGTVAAGQFTGAGQSVTYTGAQNVNGIRFTTSGSGRDRMGIDGLIVEGINCFCADTKIMTTTGEKPVQDITTEDTLLTVDGVETRVHWLGVQTINPNVRHPGSVTPVRITSGALGDGLPKRDLRLSPDHALAIDGYLINAGALVNGTTIYREHNTLSEGLTYYHIETDAHELILAEGVAAETFADFSARVDFENADEASGRVIPEMPLPRISSARLVPEHIRRRLQPMLAEE